MSAVKKAIRINSKNKRALEVQYEMDKDHLEHSSGLWLVSPFGQTLQHELLSPAAFKAKYGEVGAVLNNGYVEVLVKASQ